MAACLLALAPVGVFAQSSVVPDARSTARQQPGVIPADSFTASVSGTVVDQDGAVIAKAKVALTAGSLSRDTQSDDDGVFSFSGLPPGSFQVTVSSPGFASQTQAGLLQPAQAYILPKIQMVVATTVQVNVTQTREEIAEEQIHVQEQQRLLGVIPNYYVTYATDAVPLNRRQKFQLGWKFVLDPVSFGITGIIAGVEQATNAYSGYGQGAQGYGKRYGAAYADFVSGTFFGNVIFPAIFKQDPRYFYKGTGSRKSRLFYALANAVICKGDNGRWQPNYSSVLGSLAAGGLSNLYYPGSDRNGVGLTFRNTAIGLAGSAGSAVVQEFLFRKITSHSHTPD